MKPKADIPEITPQKYREVQEIQGNTQYSRSSGERERFLVSTIMPSLNISNQIISKYIYITVYKKYLYLENNVSF